MTAIRLQHRSLSSPGFRLGFFLICSCQHQTLLNHIKTALN